MHKKIAVLLCLTFIFTTVSACKSDPSPTQEPVKFNYTNNYTDISEMDINSEGLTWPDGQAMPTMAPVSETLDAIETASGDSLLMSTTFQGLINRKQPRVLVINPSAGEGKETWPKELGLNYNIEKDPYKVIERYKDEVKGIVIYDSKVKHTINVATTIAGLEDGIVVSSKQAEKLTAEPFNFPVIKDLTGMFTDKYEAYDYAIEELLPKCQNKLFIGLRPEQEGSSGPHLGFIRDLAVASKAFVFWLDASNSKDKEYINKFFDSAKAGESNFTGWWPIEPAGIAAAADRGIPTIPADFFENYTVYAGQSRNISVPTVPAKPALENKLYVSLILSDGDNIQYNQHAMKNLWDNSTRGDVPIGWTASPMLLDAAPKMLDYYYRTSSDNDQLISGPSGAGYTVIENWINEENFTAFAKRTDSYFRRTAFNFITVWNSVPEMQGNVMSKYIKSLCGLSTQAISTPGEKRIRIINNQLSSITLNASYTANYNDITASIKNLANSMDSSKPMFSAYQGVAWNVGPENLKKVAKSITDEFGDKVVFVRPDHLMMLANEYNGISYNISLRANVTASSEQDTASNAVDGSFTNGWKSSSDGERWITVDLGEEYSINRYVLKNAGTAYESKTLNTDEYKIQASSDNANWTDVEHVRGNTSNILDKDIDVFKARYVRLLILNPGEDGEARVQEFELYGNKDLVG